MATKPKENDLEQPAAEPAAAKTYTVLSTLNHDNVVYDFSDTIKLSDKDAAPLLAMNVIADVAE